MDADLCLDVLFPTPPVAIATARLLTQALSNTVTSNQNLVAALWETYLSLPEDQVILMYVSRPSSEVYLSCLNYDLTKLHPN
jgi:ataxin-10